MEKHLTSWCFLVGLAPRFFGVFGNLVILVGFCVVASLGAFSVLTCHLRFHLGSFVLVAEVSSALHAQPFPESGSGRSSSAPWAHIRKTYS